jgi:putative NADH-flavin reductase
MKLIILGATGGVGRELVTQAAGRGHSVTAFVRSPGKVPQQGPLVSAVPGDPCDPAALASVLPGHDAILSALGPRSLGPSTLLGDAARAARQAMERSEVRRVLVISTALLFPDVGMLGALLGRFVFRRVMTDSAAMEQVLAESELAWTVVRPPRLTFGPRTEAYRVADGALPRPYPLLASISRADVAHFLLGAAEGGTHVRKVVGVVG